jgi:hypothetical protein
MNSYQMVLHRPVETAHVLSKFTWPEGSVRLNLVTHDTYSARSVWSAGRFGLFPASLPKTYPTTIWLFDEVPPPP